MILLKLQKKNEIITSLDVWLGEKNKVGAIVANDVYITVPKRKKGTIKTLVEYTGPIQSPIAKGDKLGLLKIYVAGELIKTIDILSSEDVRKANIFLRLFKSFNFLVWGDV